SIAVADVNADGRPDVLVGGSTLMVLLNTTAPGAAVPGFTTDSFPVATPPLSVAAADVNGDGRPDLLVGSQPIGVNCDVSVRLNTTVPGASISSFGAATTSDLASPTHSVAAADVNGAARP